LGRAEEQKSGQKDAGAGELPELLLEGGRKLVYERNFGWERDVKPKKGSGRGWWT